MTAIKVISIRNGIRKKYRSVFITSEKCVIQISGVLIQVKCLKY